MHKKCEIILNIATLETFNTKNVSSVFFVSYVCSVKNSTIENKLFENIRDLFVKYGIKSLTMDDIARQLGISKKTLYISFANKRDLVKKVMEYQISTVQCEVENECIEGENAIDELMGIGRKVNEGLSDAHPSIMFDIQKYYPQAWRVLMNHKEEFVFNKMLTNLKRGMSEGLYRDNLNPEVITKAFMVMTEAMMSNQLAIPGKFNFQELHLELMRYHIRGIANGKGREYLKQKFKEDN
jgi:AcrR family transcriptional regulator